MCYRGTFCVTICVADENVVDLDTIGLRHTTNIISRASVESRLGMELLCIQFIWVNRSLSNMTKYNEVSDRRRYINNPKNGYTRVIEDRDGAKHLQIFFNGSWRHDHKCREFTNKECRKA